MSQWNSISFSTACVGQPKGPVVLAFHKFAVCEQVHVCACVSARLCVHVCTRVCMCRVSRGWSEGESSSSTLSSHTLPISQPHIPENSPILGHRRNRARGQTWDPHPLTIHALFTLLWGMRISTGSTWDHFPKGELPADSKKKKLFFFFLVETRGLWDLSSPTGD